MAVSVMILGISGTGKSASMRNCEADKFALVNVAKKPLPFKGKFEERYDGDSYQKAVDFMKKCKAKSIVIDDAQYLMGNEFMRRVTERGYDKFSEMAQNMWKLLNFINLDLPEDKVVYLLGHIERDQDGNEKFKTMGKLIDQCINVEGTCTIVLKTHVADSQYSFLTQNSGHDTVKSPMGMFPSSVIDNDLKYVDDKIRNYYELGDYLSDEEIAEADEEAAKPEPEKKKRGKRKNGEESKEEKSTETSKEEKKTKRTRKERTSTGEVDEQANDKTGESGAAGTNGRTRRSRKQEVENESKDNGASKEDANEGDSSKEVKEKPKRTRRKKAVSDEDKEAVRKENDNTVANKGLEDMEDGEEKEEPYEEEPTAPEAKKAPRRKRRTRE